MPKDYFKKIQDADDLSSRLLSATRSKIEEINKNKKDSVKIFQVVGKVPITNLLKTQKIVQHREDSCLQQQPGAWKTP